MRVRRLILSNVYEYMGGLGGSYAPKMSHIMDSAGCSHVFSTTTTTATTTTMYYYYFYYYYYHYYYSTYQEHTVYDYLTTVAATKPTTILGSGFLAARCQYS